MSKKKIAGVLMTVIAALVLLVFAPYSYADNEFSSDYKVNYDVDSSGVTEVSEQISLKNLTDRYYAKSFNLVIGATKVSEVAAADSDGPLEVQSSSEGNKTNINVDFSSQIAGKDKVYTFTLSFKSLDFAQKQGKVWQVSVPRISSQSGINNYDLTLSVPVDFGDPTSILPDPKSQDESAGKIHFHFDKSQLSDSGILANFGVNQFFDFNLTYTLSNPNILPVVGQIALPSDTGYQQVLLNSISPAPENVTIDDDGNAVAWFKLTRQQTLKVNVSGQAKLYINSRYKNPAPLTETERNQYTKADKYWEKDNPLVKDKLTDIFKNGTPASIKDQASLINQYVVNTLKYDDNKVSQGQFTRLGALTALNNPDDALCVEFTDLFIALARADNIPARELDGYAYTSNTDIRPLSLEGTILHAWPEYFDPNQGWVMIDPTWQNTTGGVDYFSKFDLNHFVFVTKGLSSTEPNTASQADVKFSATDFQPKPEISLKVDAPNQIFAGFPSSLKVEVVNKGTVNLLPNTLSLTSSQIQIAGNNTAAVNTIPPFGHLDYTFKLRTKNFWQSFDNVMELDIDGQKVYQPISVRPFFAFRFFPILIIVVILAMVGSYLFILKRYLSPPIVK